MIIALAALLVAQTGEPTVRRQEIVTRSPSYPFELRELVGRYHECLSPGGRRQYAQEASIAAEHRVDVERCDPEMPAIIEAAIEIRARGRGRDAARTEVVDLFGRLRESHVQSGVQMDQFLGRTTPSGQAETSE